MVPVTKRCPSCLLLETCRELPIIVPLHKLTSFVDVDNFDNYVFPVRSKRLSVDSRPHVMFWIFSSPPKRHLIRGSHRCWRARPKILDVMECFACCDLPNQAIKDRESSWFVLLGFNAITICQSWCCKYLGTVVGFLFCWLRTYNLHTVGGSA